MADSIEKVFVRAIWTIKALSTSKGPDSLPKPPVHNRIRLYGLYKQATEGDVEGIMRRPTGRTPEDSAGRRKWDAWKQEEGVSKIKAKHKYISFLIETMREYASDTQEARKLLSDLEYLWAQVKDIDLSVIKTNEVTPSPLPQYSGSMAGSYTSYDTQLRPSGGESFVSGLPYGSDTVSAAGYSNYGSQLSHPQPSLRATPKKEYIADSVSSDSLEMRKWRRDVSWALETINEEIMAIRQRHAIAMSDAASVLPASSEGGLRSPRRGGRASRPPPRNKITGRPSTPSYSHVRNQSSIYSYKDESNVSVRAGNSIGRETRLRNANGNDSAVSQTTLRIFNVLHGLAKKQVWRILTSFLWGFCTRVVVDVIVLAALLSLLRRARDRWPGSTMAAQILSFWAKLINGM